MQVDVFSTWCLRALAFLACLIGVVWAIDHTHIMFLSHNYLLAPLGDDAIDAYNNLYPIALKQKSWFAILASYGDHRLGFARIQALLEFYFTHGMQILQPFRLALILWLDSIIFIYFVLIKNTLIPRIAKLFVAGILLSVLFSGLTINNYGSTYMTTWPWIILFALLAFILTNQYCDALEKNANRSVIAIYIALITMIVNLGFYTFSIGLMLWPVIFVLMYKRLLQVEKLYRFPKEDGVKDANYKLNVGFQIIYKKNTSYHLGCQFGIFLLFAIASYYYYLRDVLSLLLVTLNTSTVNQGPIVQKYIYLLRMLCYPIISKTTNEADPEVLIAGSIVLALVISCIYQFLKRPKWSKATGLLAAMLLYNFLAILVIAYTRGTNPQEIISTLRFSTPVFMVIVCLSASLLMFASNNTLLKRPFAYLILMGLIAVFYPVIFIERSVSQVTLYNLTIWNQFLIGESIGIPLDPLFAQQFQMIQNEANLTQLAYLNSVQKNYKLGAYSLEVTSYIGHSINSLPFSKENFSTQASLNLYEPDAKFTHRKDQLLSVVLQDPQYKIDPNWDVIFVNSNGIIAGYARSGFLLSQPRIRLLFRSSTTHLWRGALNSQFLNKDNKISVWVINKPKQKLIFIGSNTISDPPF